MGQSRRGARRGSAEDGNILVLFAVLLGLMLMVGALAIDVGYWWVAGKRAQIAADACALAAAQELPHDYEDLPNCAIAAGQADYVLTHLPDQTQPDADPKHIFTRVRSPYDGVAGKVGPPYDGDATMVEATVQLRVGTFFGRIFGVDEVIVERRAVAERIEGETKLAIFAGSTSCADQKGLYIDGDAINVTGHVHSNGEYTINGAAAPNQAKITSGTIAKENCVAETSPDGPPASGAGAKFGDGDEWLPQDGDELQWPDWWYPADFGWYLPEQRPAVPGRCTYKGQKIEVNDTDLKVNGTVVASLLPHPDPLKVGWDIIPQGTYCATESFTVTGEKHEGRITVLAPIIVIGGKGQKYEPYAYDMLFFTVANSDTDNPGNDGPYTLGNFNPPELPPYPPCQPSPAIETTLNGEGFTWAGIIFNPCGKVYINVKTSDIGTAELVGTIYAFQVHVDGDDFNMIGTEDIEQNVSIALYE